MNRHPPAWLFVGTNDWKPRMLVDAESLEKDASLHADVSVVGAGPAGIVLSLALAEVGFRVNLVESGHLRPSDTIQKLGDAEHFDPARHAPMSECTRRQLGGASVIWGGRCVPYDPVDFDERDYIPHSNWPVQFDELTPYFPKACEYFFCGKSEFDVKNVPGVEQTSIVPGLPDGEVLSSTLERWSLPTDFGKEYAKQLARSERINVVHGLTCTEIACDESGSRVAYLQGKTLDGKAVRLQSRTYIIACGGLETTRLLLASNRTHPNGIGNHSGLLGRYYMGHVSGQIARVQFSTDPRKTVYGFDRDADGVYLRRRFSFSREFQHDKKLTNIVAWLVNPKIYDPSHGNGVLSFAYLALTSTFGKYFASEAIRKAAAGGERRGSIWPHLLNMLRDLPRTAAFIPTFGYRRFVAWRKVPGFFQYSKANSYLLHYHGEQVPNRDSRVTLSDETDALGMPRLVIDLRFCDQDVDSVIRAHQYLDKYLQRHDCGHLEYLTEDGAASVWEQASDGFHQCGTTRMSTDPADGVLTPNANVHGVDNLFVVSSSMFVTSGQANSTFMIVAFALRLVDHLKKQLSC